MSKVKKSTRKINLVNGTSLKDFFSRLNQNHLKDLENNLFTKFDIVFRLNGSLITLKINKDKSQQVYNNFMKLSTLKKVIQKEDIFNACGNKLEVEEQEIVIDKLDNFYEMTFSDKKGVISVIKPKTDNQKLLIDEILNKKVVLALGASGTGKSIISIAVAVKLLEQKKIQKIILAKPIVDAANKIGYTPGSIQEKLDPYVASSMAILGDLIGIEQRDKYIKLKQIEIANIGYMRGITIGTPKCQTIAIIEEAQNLDPGENKLIISRLGEAKYSKIIYTADNRQKDTVGNRDNIMNLYNLIKDDAEVGGIIFSRQDIVRSGIVRRLMEILELEEDKIAEEKEEKNRKTD